MTKSTTSSDAFGPGVVLLDGANLGTGVAAAAAGDAAAIRLAQREVQERVLHVVAQALYECRGNVVIIIDEAQKAQARAFDTMSALFANENAVLSYVDTAGVVMQLDARRAVLLFVSDVGVPDVETAIYSTAVERHLATEGLTAATPTLGGGTRQSLPTLLRKRLAERAADMGINLAAHAAAVVPFLPFQQAGVQALYASHLTRMAARPAPEAWQTLKFANALALAQLMSDRTFTAYRQNATKYASMEKEYRARAVSSGGSGSATVRADGSADALVPDEVDACAAGTGNLVCCHAQPQFAFAEWGARHLDPRAQGSAIDILHDLLTDVASRVPRAALSAKSSAVVRTVEGVKYGWWARMGWGGGGKSSEREVTVTVECRDRKGVVAAERRNERLLPSLRVRVCDYLKLSMSDGKAALPAERWASLQKWETVWAYSCTNAYDGPLQAGG